jgi:aminoglycoside phosphotransferase (APT) family kinase protein
MELNELEERLVPFCKAMYEDEEAKVSDVYAMPGHAGFAYGFTAESGSLAESWFLRLPPPNVKLQGTADVLRQVAVLNALDGTSVPHCSIKWSGDDPQWFGRPYFTVPKLEGDVIRIEDGGWVRGLSEEIRRDMGRQVMTALAGIHKVDPAEAKYLGPPIDFEDDVTRWDRFVEKAADPERMILVPEVRKLLLDKIPKEAPVGIFHGDFQWSNLFCSPQGKLLAVIDWELVGVGATLNDVGWIATFNDADAWADNRNPGEHMPNAQQLIVMYTDAYDGDVDDVNWYRALAAYKFAIITGFNLMLHRRGKRVDPVWEVTKESVEPLFSRARDLLIEL